MDGQVGYTRSRDGTRIAYSVAGSGAPLLVVAPPLISNVLIPPVEDGLHASVGVIQKGRSWVSVDLRGCGASERDIRDYSLDRRAEDVLAVADAIGVAWFDLFTSDATLAIRLAATPGGRVRRLVLLAPLRRHRGLAGGLGSLLETDFDAFLGTMARLTWSFRDEDAPAAVARMRQCVTQADLLRMNAAVATYDVTADLEHVGCPVLVVAVAKNVLDTTSDSAQVAALIPGARLRIWPYDDELRCCVQLYEATAAFFNEGLEGGEDSPPLSPRELEVLRMVADGRSNKAIAQELVVSVRTVDRHVSDIYTKLDLHNRAEATAWAIRNRVV